MSKYRLFVDFFLVSVSKELLHDLYFGDRTLDGLEFKWNALGWIMSFSNDEISRIKQLPKQMRLIVTILHDLVKVSSSLPLHFISLIKTLHFRNLHFYSTRKSY